MNTRVYSRARLFCSVDVTDVQSIPENTYDELWSNTVEHLSRTHERKQIIRLPTSIELLDCSASDEDGTAVLNIALADQV
jgi:hypothetical protein